MSGNPFTDFLNPKTPSTPDKSKVAAEKQKEDKSAERQREEDLDADARRKGRLATILAGGSGAEGSNVKLGKTTVLGGA